MSESENGVGGVDWTSAGRGSRITPPSSLLEATRLGVAWAESVEERVCKGLDVAAWPPWPSYDAAPAKSIEHARALVAPLHVHVTHACTAPETRTDDMQARRRASEEALARACFEAARARYAELAAWRFS